MSEWEFIQLNIQGWYALENRYSKSVVRMDERIIIVRLVRRGDICSHISHPRTDVNEYVERTSSRSLPVRTDVCERPLQERPLQELQKQSTSKLKIICCALCVNEEYAFKNHIFQPMPSQC